MRLGEDFTIMGITGRERGKHGGNRNGEIQKKKKGKEQWYRHCLCAHAVVSHEPSLALALRLHLYDGKMRAAGEDTKVDTRSKPSGTLLIQPPSSFILHLLLLGLSQERLSLCIRHRPPFGRSQHALLCRLGLVAKDVLHQPGVGAYTLKEHEVCGEGLLGCVWVLDVALARFARFALGSAEEVLALDVVGGEGTHVGFVFLFPSFLHRLRATFVGLRIVKQKYVIEKQ